MKILVTGSAGHLGEALIKVLGRDYEVVGVDLLPSPFTRIVGDLADQTVVEAAMQGVDIVLHAATLHKPHVVTHSEQDFVSANVSATLNLLQAASRHQVKSFIFTSTTSTFGDAMIPEPEAPATWITEEVMPIPKNIYGVTKTAAEDLCKLYARNHGLPCLVLRTSRFFLEKDDNPARRGKYEDDNIKVNELLVRRVDLEDIVEAHRLAMLKAPEIGYSKYIISATSPFQPEDRLALMKDAGTVVEKYYPSFREVFAQKNWQMFPTFGRVYVNEKARRELGWKPAYDFGTALAAIAEGKDFRSPLARAVGIKGYHDQQFDEGPYPV
ncbi:MAG: NAD(P)-dependent oxidoreductase [Bacteroidota bacterium]